MRKRSRGQRKDPCPAGRRGISGPAGRDCDSERRVFPFRAVREIDIGLARVVCVRITYLGELGYELNIPAEQAVHVYDRIVEAGKQFGLRHAGLKALASLRLEKGYRDYGHDIDNTDDPYETGLGFAVALNKPGDFIGKSACEAKKAAGPYSQRLVQILLQDPQPLMYHAEVVLRDGKVVGDVRAAAYGQTQRENRSFTDHTLKFDIPAVEPRNLSLLNRPASARVGGRRAPASATRATSGAAAA